MAQTRHPLDVLNYVDEVEVLMRAQFTVEKGRTHMQQQGHVTASMESDVEMSLCEGRMHSRRGVG